MTHSAENGIQDYEKRIEEFGIETLEHLEKRVKSFLDEIHSIYENETVLVVTHNFISKCIWILENNIQSSELINGFFHDNREIKYYKPKERKNDFDER